MHNTYFDVFAFHNGYGPLFMDQNLTINQLFVRLIQAIQENELQAIDALTDYFLDMTIDIFEASDTNDWSHQNITIDDTWLASIGLDRQKDEGSLIIAKHLECLYNTLHNSKLIIDMGDLKLTMDPSQKFSITFWYDGNLCFIASHHSKGNRQRITL